MRATAYIHYTRNDGLPTYALGELSTEHPASSYGLPVWVSSEHPNARDGDPIHANTAYGPADLSALVPLYDMAGYFGHELKALIQAAGYRLGESAL